MELKHWLGFCLGIATMSQAAPQRCQSYEGAKCTEIRDQAIAIGCVTAGEAAVLALNNLVPMCVATTHVGDCSCGCFAPESKLLTQTFGEESTAAEIFHSSQTENLVEAKWMSRDSLALSLQKITQKMEGEEAQFLVRLTLENGRVLRLTDRHPVILSNGSVITAREVHLGQKLTSVNNEPIKVTGVSRDFYQGKVYNFKLGPQRTLVAEGVVVGDLALQNALDDEVEAVRVRE